jgi:hypothetical protein
MATAPKERPVIGWREWVRLPGLGDATVKAKVDTGARTSTLHAFDVCEEERDGTTVVLFRFNPDQRDENRAVRAEAPLVDRRTVTASNGQSELRYVVATEIVIDEEPVEIELTLTRRDAMGFRMLLGRRALRGRYVVDPMRSYRAGVSKRIRRRARRERLSR